MLGSILDEATTHYSVANIVSQCEPERMLDAGHRDTRISTTLDLYAQTVPEPQRQAIDRTATMALVRFAKYGGVRSIGRFWDVNQ
jgi:hypothetical protein